MTTEEAADLKRDAENRIVDILNDLETATKCKVRHISLTDKMEEGVLSSNPILVGRQVDINLEIE